MNLNKRFPNESLEQYHVRLRAQQEDTDYRLRGRIVRPVESEKFDERLLCSFNEFSDHPNKAGNLPFVNRKQERAYHSATPRHQRFAQEHPSINL